MKFLSKFAYNENDSEDIRLAKLTAIIVSGSCTMAGVVWTIMYYFIFGWSLVTYLPAGFVVIVGAAIFIAHQTKNHLLAVHAQIICIIYVTSLIQWTMGGGFDSGFVMAWAFCGPVTALTFFSVKRSAFWMMLFLINIIITVVFDDYFSDRTEDVPSHIRQLFFIMNIGISSLVVFIFASFFVSNTLKERQRADNLLLNILPKSIAKILKKNTQVIADKHENVSVLFADIVGFTSYASQSTPENLVAKLDTIFTRFDSLAIKYDLEKIKTIGDAYMVAGGLADKVYNHCNNIGLMALDMQTELKELNQQNNTNFSIRIGIHCGPVVAGVIGHSKFAYDLWGDTVNVASRMESSGETDKIQVSSHFYENTSQFFHFERRGMIELKGKGETEAYFLMGAK